MSVIKYFQTASELYKSSQWEKFRAVLIAQRTNEKGELFCADCGKTMYKKYEIIAHHRIPIDTLNLNNVEITFNQDNIDLICFKCHNLRHSRFDGQKKRVVIIVHGSPCSGKTTFVKENATKDDVIIDLDTIWECFSNNPRYVKPDTLKSFMFSVYNAAIDAVMTRTGFWQECYVIGSLPRVMDRQRLADKLGAELIHIDTDKDTCISRLHDNPGGRNIQEYEKFIEKYWEEYQEQEILNNE